MSNSLTWLHLSDWHQRGPDFERKAVRDALLADLRQRGELDVRLEQIDFIVFSGDLAFSGHPAEYQAAAREFLEPVLQVANVTRDRLFMVPGNHDLSRTALRFFSHWLDIFPGLKEINAALIDSSQRQTLLRPMDAYADFVRTFYGARAVAEPSYGFLSTFEVRGISISAIGMNTAWLSGQRIENGEVNDFGALALGEPQFYDLMQDRAFQEADLRLGILHHPFSWLNARFDHSRIEQTLTRGFHFLLRGHEHEARIAVPNGTDGHCAIISAGAAYERRDGKTNGYNLAHIDFDKSQGTVFLRRYDINRGFLKDTNTTGDRTPGYHRFKLPRRLIRFSSRIPKRERAAKYPAVERVFNHRSPDVVDAIDIYTARIPSREQVSAPDLIRYLRDDEERRRAGLRSRDFMFVAKQRDGVCGFALLHSSPEHKIAFVAYLAAIQGVKGEDWTISAALVEEVAKLFAPGGELADHSGILLEVEDPRAATSPGQEREQLARIRLFCTLATRLNFSLRALDFPYKQPLLHIPRESDRGREIPLLLMVTQPHRILLGRYLDRQRVRELLAFVYQWLYPEEFSEIEEENHDYRLYVNKLHSELIEMIPDNVPTVDFREIQSWCGEK
jgi:Calcineurin-like phosphoesterase